MADKPLVVNPPYQHVLQPVAADAPPPAPPSQTPPQEGVEPSAPPKPLGKDQDARLRKFAKNTLGINFEEPSDAPPEDKPKDKDKAAPDAPKPPKAGKPPKPSPKTIPPLPGRDPSEERQELAATVAREVAGALKPKAEPAPEVVLSDEDKSIVEVLAHMGTMYPERKNLASEYQRALAEQEKYEAKWQSEHPDETFDPDAAEHQGFYERNNPEIPDRLYQIAAADLVAEKKNKPLQDQLKAEQTERNRLQRLRDSEPDIHRESMQAAKALVDQIEGVENVIGEDLKIDQVKLAKYAEEHPLEAEIVGQAMNATAALAKSVYQLFNGLSKFDKANADHATIEGIANEMEVKLMALPPEQQLNERDQRFLPSNQYYDLKPEKRSQFWTLDARAVNGYIAAGNARWAKTEVQNKREWIAKVTKQPISQNGHAPKPTQEPKPKAEVQPLKPRSESTSPSMTPEPFTPSAGGKPSGQPKNVLERFTTDMLR